MSALYMCKQSVLDATTPFIAPREGSLVVDWGHGLHVSHVSSFKVASIKKLLHATPTDNRQSNYTHSRIIAKLLLFFSRMTGWQCWCQPSPDSWEAIAVCFSDQKKGRHAGQSPPGPANHRNRHNTSSRGHPASRTDLINTPSCISHKWDSDELAHTQVQGACIEWLDS